MTKRAPETLTVERNGQWFTIHRAAAGTFRIGERLAVLPADPRYPWAPVRRNRKLFGVWDGDVTTEAEALACAQAILAAAERWPKAKCKAPKYALRYQSAQTWRFNNRQPIAHSEAAS